MIGIILYGKLGQGIIGVARVWLWDHTEQEANSIGMSVVRELLLEIHRLFVCLSACVCLTQQWHVLTPEPGVNHVSDSGLRGRGNFLLGCPGAMWPSVKILWPLVQNYSRLLQLTDSHIVAAPLWTRFSMLTMGKCAHAKYDPLNYPIPWGAPI